MSTGPVTVPLGATSPQFAADPRWPAPSPYDFGKGDRAEFPFTNTGGKVQLNPLTNARSGRY